MTTKSSQSNIDLDRRHFEKFKHCIPELMECDNRSLEMLLEKGLLQVSTCFEHALANVKNLTVIGADSHDLSDGADAKISSVRTHSSGACYGAPIRGLKNKTGNLYVQVYERKQNRFYYFDIPYHAYKDIPSSSNIEIPFDLMGNPKPPTRAAKYNWWKYRVDSFFPEPPPVKIKAEPLTWFQRLKQRLGL